MKNYVWLLLLLASCSVRRSTPGSYYGSDTEYVKRIKLDKNGSFMLSVNNFGRVDDFLGSWIYLSKDTLQLTYNLEDFPRIIKSQHVTEKIEQVVLLNNNQLKYNRFVLRKQGTDNLATQNLISKAAK